MLFISSSRVKLQVAIIVPVGKGKEGGEMSLLYEGLVSWGLWQTSLGKEFPYNGAATEETLPPSQLISEGGPSPSRRWTCQVLWKIPKWFPGCWTSRTVRLAWDFPRPTGALLHKHATSLIHWWPVWHWAVSEEVTRFRCQNGAEELPEHIRQPAAG